MFSKRGTTYQVAAEVHYAGGALETAYLSLDEEDAGFRICGEPPI